MNYVTRNPFARFTIRSERVPTTANTDGTRIGQTCTECGSQRLQRQGTRAYLLRFHVDDDQGPRHSGPIANGKLFCSRACCEQYTGQRFDA